MSNWQEQLHGECKFLSCELHNIMDHAIVLLGHGKVDRSTLISSKRGQVVYPAFFESSTLMRGAILQLCAFPGYLNMNSMRFERLVDGWIYDGKKFPELESENVIEKLGNSLWIREGKTFKLPTDFLPPHPLCSDDAPLYWRVAVYDDVLHGEILPAGAESEAFSAWKLMETMCYSLLTLPCKHGSNTLAGDLAYNFTHITEIGGFDPLRQHFLLSTGRDYGRQLSSLTSAHGDSEASVLMHVEGCIRCALQLCLDYDIRYCLIT